MPPDDPNKQTEGQATQTQATQTQGSAKQDPLIDPKRVEQLEQVNQQLSQKLNELESTVSKTSQRQQSGQTWETVSDRDLQYIVTHPIDYPDHASAALEELRKRDRAAIRSELVSEFGSSQVREQNPEAFDPTTPVGKEVAKILARDRGQRDILTDVIELAKFRIEGASSEEKGRKKTVDALKAASAHAPGSESSAITPPPSFLEMPKDEFQKHLESVKMKGFK